MNVAYDKIAIRVKSHRLLKILLKENPVLERIMMESRDAEEALESVRNWVLSYLKKRPLALKYYYHEVNSADSYTRLRWKDYAAIRILDYIDNADRKFSDLNNYGEVVLSNPMKLVWLAINHGTGGAKPEFFEDMIHLFRQYSGAETRITLSVDDIEEMMNRHPSGIESQIVTLREENRDRILKIIISKIESGEIKSRKYFFEEGQTDAEKFSIAQDWWKDYRFHLSFAVRSPRLLNELLGNSLDPDTMNVLYEAEEVGIPFFVNPYYLSLVQVRTPYFAIGADLAIREYILYSKQLVQEFGKITAWEGEDVVQVGKPNAAGWLLPTRYNIHRRYPDVAILIPDTAGRTCGGLCTVCQRMYDFQTGHLNFDLKKLKPTNTWPERLKQLMGYFENDSQLRDILITGGDALMSSDHSLKNILDAVYEMAKRKQEANRQRPDGEKFAEIQRIRLGTRLPVYLPQRVTSSLVKILKEFRVKAREIGVQNFVIQTHFASPMEITPEVKKAIGRLISSGWLVTNQHVFVTAASRRGHAAKLRQVLNEIGVLPYYNFTVKGYNENKYSFVPSARSMQEQLEEKIHGKIPEDCYDKIKNLSSNPENIIQNIEGVLNETGLPFLATDRNVLNLPGVGKSQTFRVIGITRTGKRILEFEHDNTRAHSPIIEKLGNFVAIESKSIAEYLRQIEELGEDLDDYRGIYGYSLGQTEPRMPLYEYPPFDFTVTQNITNLDLGDDSMAIPENDSNE